MNPIIKCKKCNNTFEPDVKTKDAWQCPSCQTKNPNLKRHYRSVADIYGIWFVFTVIFTLLAVTARGVDLGVMLSSAHGVLLLVTIIFVYKSKTPWTDTPVRVLIWSVLGIKFLFNVVIPLLFSMMLSSSELAAISLGTLVVLTIICLYLSWLTVQGNKCTAPTPPPMPTKEESESST